MSSIEAHFLECPELTYLQRDPISSMDSELRKKIRPPSQVQNAAFNLKGWAMEDGMKGRKIKQLISAYEPSATPCIDWLQMKEIPLF